jgi:hypothetical protein
MKNRKTTLVVRSDFAPPRSCLAKHLHYKGSYQADKNNLIDGIAFGRLAVIVLIVPLKKAV